jgi:hypothetical protein
MRAGTDLHNFVVPPERDLQSPFERGSTPKLVLLFGTPRSGTTWLGKIFDSHRLTLYKHEPDRSGFAVPFAAPMENAEQWRVPVLNFAARLTGINTPHTSARLPVFHKAYRSPLFHPLHRISVFLTGSASWLGWNWRVQQFANVQRPDVRLVWKSTDSLGRLGVILRALDNCRTVWIVRHPCGYINSVLRGEALQRFVASVPTSEDYGIMQKLIDAAGSRAYDLTLDHMRKFHSVERMAWIWVLLNEKAMRDTAEDPHCISVRYEDVCRNPIETTKVLFAFCGLDWDPQTAEFIRASTRDAQTFVPFRSHSRRYYSIFRDPLKSAEKWKSEMSEENVTRVYRVLSQSRLADLYPESESLPLNDVR